MKTLIRSILLLVAVAAVSFGCEGHNFAETQKLHKSHGAHDDHAGGGHAEKGDHAEKTDTKEADHPKEKKGH